ncbi:MAG: SIMPL domain-containing protein [Mycobacteriaceae bacterium]
MKKLLTALLITATGAATLALSSCSSDEPTSTADDAGVTVIGTGEVRGAPDILHADIGVSVQGTDVSGALSTANDLARTMIDAMVNAGAKKEDITTTNLSVNPDYTPDGQVNGYQATNTVAIIIRDLGKASAVLNAGTAAGGNSSQLSGVRFAIDDDSTLLTQARERAFTDAKSRAEQYAALSGLKLGNIITISESHNTPEYPTGRLYDAAASPMTLEPGQQTVTFQVTARWALTK